MKTFRIFTLMLLALLALGSCSTDEIVAPAAALDGAPNVRFTLGGAAKVATQSRATIESENGEKTVNSLLAILFDTHKGFYKTIEARPEGDEYGIIVEDDATYDIYLVANADDDLHTALEGITEGSTTDCLESVIASQAPDADGKFLMLSKTFERVTTQITKTYSIGEVHMERLAARFDIVNGAEGVEVTKLTFNNRAVKSTLALANDMSEDLTGWFETKEYTPNNFVGDKDNPARYEHEIYTYENYSAKDSETLPSLTIEYTEDGKTKTHDVLLIDPDATDTTPLAIKRNHLYRINLSKAYKLEFNLEVADWNEEEAFEVKELPVALEETDWQSLNEQLLVYKLFTPYNVKSLNTADKTVEFFDDLTNEAEAGSFFSYRSLDQAGFTKNEIMTDADGNKYRMPTYGELQLIVAPLASAGNCIPLDESVDVTGLRFYPNWSSAENYQAEFSEKVYLKNTLSGNMSVAKEFDPEQNPEDGFKGISVLRKKDYAAERRYTFKEDNYSIHTTPELSTSSISYRPVYAIRFKGTSEYAAYLYESLPKNDDPNCTDYYASVKIKALPKDADITIDDVAYNHSFWNDGYIQYTFPLVGIDLNGTNKYKNGALFLLSSTAYNTNYVKAISEDFSSFFLGNLAWNTGVSLRLVRVLNETPAE